MRKRWRYATGLHADQSGASLVLALLIAFILLTLATTIVHFSSTNLITAQKQNQQSSAYYIAEAGLEHAVQEINRQLQGGSFDPGQLNLALTDVSFENGSYTVRVEEIKNEYGELTGYHIFATGRFADATRTIRALARQPVGHPTPLDFALFAEEDLSVQTLTLLGHTITVNGDVHANGIVNIRHNGLLPPPPDIDGIVSSTDLSQIHVAGLDPSQKRVRPHMSLPSFDFDAARKMAQKEGIYHQGDVTAISLLGLSPTDKIIFIDGDLTLTGLDLLGLSLEDRTIVVNGTITGLLEVGGVDLVNTRLNLIAKEDILFVGLVTGLQINGILFAQGIDSTTHQPDPDLGHILTDGHVEVVGYAGARNIGMGNGLITGLLSDILSLITGKMAFDYDPQVFETFPSHVGFKQNHIDIVNVIEVKEIHP
ncbi:MAG: hypothetical protein H0Z33_08750 [Bacillaceae bacterium]|nr:hypothetical protein [Bacillaceae bacterium]